MVSINQAPNITIRLAPQNVGNVSAATATSPLQSQGLNLGNTRPATAQNADSLEFKTGNAAEALVAIVTLLQGLLQKITGEGTTGATDSRNRGVGGVDNCQGGSCSEVGSASQTNQERETKGIERESVHQAGKAGKNKKNKTKNKAGAEAAENEKTMLLEVIKQLLAKLLQTDQQSPQAVPAQSAQSVQRSTPPGQAQQTRDTKALLANLLQTIVAQLFETVDVSKTETSSAKDDTTVGTSSNTSNTDAKKVTISIELPSSSAGAA